MTQLYAATGLEHSLKLRGAMCGLFSEIELTILQRLLYSNINILQKEFFKLLFPDPMTELHLELVDILRIFLSRFSFFFEFENRIPELLQLCVNTVLCVDI